VSIYERLIPSSLGGAISFTVALSVLVIVLVEVQEFRKTIPENARMVMAIS
jgi:hypothetical protein